MSITRGPDQAAVRLREARKRAGMSQAALGECMGLDKTQVSKIESARRRLDISEVALAADALGISTRELLGMQDRGKLALAARLATNAPGDSLVAPRQRARQLIEIDHILSEVAGLRPATPSTASERLLELGRGIAARPTPSKAAAQRDGEELADLVREHLDLGSDAIGNLADLIETHFGVDVALSPLGTNSDGLCVHGDDTRLIIASSDFPAGHVRFTLAHELAHHLLGDPREVINEAEAEMYESNPIEWRASAFAGHFLVPRNGIEVVLSHLGDNSPLKPATVAHLMVHFQVSLHALVYQLTLLGYMSFDEGQELRGRGAGNLLEAWVEPTAMKSAMDRPQSVRPPLRLHQAVLEAFANRQIGLGPVASLFEQPDDENFYRQVVRAVGLVESDVTADSDFQLQV